MPNLEDLSHSNDADDVGAEADINNMKSIISFCRLKGIKKEFSVPRTLQQNGIAERKNRTLIEAARTLLAYSLLLIPFWAEAVNTACYVQNRTMNYLPVITENQTNSNIGFQDIEKEREEGTQTYVLFPVLSHGFTNSQNNNKDALVDGKEHDDDIQKFVSLNIHSLSSGAQTRKQGDKTENKDKEFEECNITSSNGVNAASSSVSTAGQNSINGTND
nr:putative ribonuclease H-like domain-containing protein [Tanacetum cinerariifolium]